MVRFFFFFNQSISQSVRCLDRCFFSFSFPSSYLSAAPNIQVHKHAILLRSTSTLIHDAYYTSQQLVCNKRSLLLAHVCLYGAERDVYINVKTYTSNHILVIYFLYLRKIIHNKLTLIISSCMIIYILLLLKSVKIGHRVSSSIMVPSPFHRRLIPHASIFFTHLLVSFSSLAAWSPPSAAAPVSVCLSRCFSSLNEISERVFFF